MTTMLDEVKSFFADLQSLKEAEQEAMAAQQAEAPQRKGAVSDSAHAAMLALANHEAAAQAEKSGGISNASAKLTPAQIAKHHNLISSELLGTPEQPGLVRKHAERIAKKMRVDPEELVSQYAAGGSKSGTKLPMQGDYMHHGKEALAGNTQPGSLEAMVRNKMGKLALDLGRSKRRKKEKPLQPDMPGGADTSGDLSPGAEKSARQREMAPPRATIFNDEQKRLADLIHKHIEDARKNHGEKGTELAIHPDTMHDILHGHFFHGKSGSELAQEYGHKIPLKKASGDPVKDDEARRKRLYNELKGFQHLISPHFDKPRESTAPDDDKIAAATKTVSDFAPDPEENPQGHAEFAKAAKLYRSVNKQQPNPRKRQLPIEQDPNTRLSRESPKTNRAIGRLKTLKKPQPIEDPNAEPETPQAAPVTAHDSPRTPGMESVSLAGRLFGESLATIIGSVR